MPHHPNAGQTEVVTLPARSLPDATEPASSPPAQPAERELAFPLRFLAVIGVSTLVIVLCVLGAVISGGFGLFSGEADAAPSVAAGPSLTYQVQVVTPGTKFDDGQWIVGLDVLPGNYETTVPADSSGCAWEHAGSADGTVNSIKSTGTANAGERVQVLLRAEEEVIRSEGCGTWQRTHN